MAFPRNCQRQALALGICLCALGVTSRASAQQADSVAPSDSDAAAAPPDVVAPTPATATIAPPSNAAEGPVEAPDATPEAHTLSGAAPDPSAPLATAPEIDATGNAKVDTTGLEQANDEQQDRVRYQLERIELRGNARTRVNVILRYLPFRPGKQLDVDDPEFTLARYRLLGTGFFRDVQFSLRKGSKRGKVVLIVDLEERNTVVVNGIWFGLSADSNSQGKQQPLSAYGGVDVAETNVGGSGYSLGGAIGIARGQYAWRLRFSDPGFLGSPWMITGSLLHNHALDFFGSGTVRFAPTESATPQPTSHAVLPYSRFGGSIGIGRDISVSSQLWFHYRLERIRADVPAFAQEDGRGKIEPIQFDILNGSSVFSAVRANFQSDTRDHPFLPTQGWLISTWGELGLAPFGSDYDYQRFDISASSWWKVKGTEHVFRLQGFAGAMSGRNVPFFEQYYVGDFSDFLPARMLGLNMDSRTPWNFFGTSIGTVRYGHYAAEVAGEYRVPVYRGHRSVFGIDFFLRAGLWGIANHRDLIDPAPRYKGLQNLPIDFTANVGFRMDTSAGGLVFSFSNVLGFLPVRGGG